MGALEAGPDVCAAGHRRGPPALSLGVHLPSHQSQKEQPWSCPQLLAVVVHPSIYGLCGLSWRRLGWGGRSQGSPCCPHTSALHPQPQSPLLPSSSAVQGTSRHPLMSWGPAGSLSQPQPEKAATWFGTMVPASLTLLQVVW